MSDSVQPHRWQPTRLHHPWDSPGKNTGVGCHFLLQCMKVKSESEVAQSCPTPSDSMDCSLPGSSIHGIFQARVLKWGAIASPCLRLHFMCSFEKLAPFSCLDGKMSKKGCVGNKQACDQAVIKILPDFQEIFHLLTSPETTRRGILCSVFQSCPTLCDPMDCSTPGFPVLHHLPAFAQTHVH